LSAFVCILNPDCRLFATNTTQHCTGTSH
jgi:hypothetical protein